MTIRVTTVGQPTVERRGVAVRRGRAPRAGGNGGTPWNTNRRHREGAQKCRGRTRSDERRPGVAREGERRTYHRRVHQALHVSASCIDRLVPVRTCAPLGGAVSGRWKTKTKTLPPPPPVFPKTDLSWQRPSRKRFPLSSDYLPVWSETPLPKCPRRKTNVGGGV